MPSTHTKKVHVYLYRCIMKRVQTLLLNTYIHNQSTDSGGVEEVVVKTKSMLTLIEFQNGLRNHSGFFP